MAETMSPKSPFAESPVDSPMDGGTTPTNDAVFDWSAFYDDDGRIYYYNSVTNESAWDAPENFNPPPPRDPVGTDLALDEEAPQDPSPTVDEDDVVAEEEEVVEEAEIELEKSEEQGEGTWVAYEDDQGRTYYYNTETGGTQWDVPANFSGAEATVEHGDDLSPNRSPSPTSSPVPSAIEGDEEETESVAENIAEPEEVIDPAVKRLECAEKALNEPDAIMEPGCLGYVGEVLAGYGGSVGAQKATQALIDSFHGQTAICGVLGLWLADLKSSSSSSSSSSNAENPTNEESFNTAADDVREVAQDVVNRVAKDRFTKTGGDNILNLSKSEAAFLEEMIDSSRWRKLLIDLSATNKDSALLMYCLQAISKRGHHREIAKRINQSDHFAVYNAMLASEFAVVGRAAVSASADTDNSVGMDELVDDLRRTCTSTSYTYLYATEVLRDLVSSAYDAVAADPDRSMRLRGSIRKWMRLSEELEGAMLDPAVSSATAGSSTLFRKRRLDVAITISELHQRQRRRRNPVSSSSKSEVDNSGNDRHLDELETALVNLLRRYAVGSPFDDRVLDQLLQADHGESTSADIGKLLVAHPLSIKALLGHLFKPGSSRVSSMVTRNKCSRLIAFATIAAKAAVKMEDDKVSEDGPDESEAEEITTMLLTGSQLCELLENMVSFTVNSDADTGGDDSSAGMKLCALALKCAPIAQGVVMWATEITKGPEFVSSASYPTLSPSILSLVRIISARHPFTRREVLEVALIFLRHSNSELSYQKMNDIREQCLRLLLFLLVHGEVASVLGNISSRLRQQGNSEIDASLVRYFVGGLLDILRPPYSFLLMRQLGAMFSAPKCIDALRSSYFRESSKKQLSALIESFKGSLSQANNGGSTAEDSTLVSTLHTIYSS